MSSGAAAPRRSNWVLWGVLAVLLVFGAVGLGTVVFGLTTFAANELVGSAAIALGGLGAFLAFLFTAGILYRVDRARGANQRTVALFE